MRILASMLSLGVCLVVMGCSVPPDPESEDEKEGVFEPMTNSLEKANQVELQIHDQKSRMDQAISDAESDLDDIEEESDD